jgi:hypothetical protein
MEAEEEEAEGVVRSKSPFTDIEAEEQDVILTQQTPSKMDNFTQLEMSRQISEESKADQSDLSQSVLDISSATQTQEPFQTALNNTSGIRSFWITYYLLH